MVMLKVEEITAGEPARLLLAPALEAELLVLIGIILYQSEAAAAVLMAMKAGPAAMVIMAVLMASLGALTATTTCKQEGGLVEEPEVGPGVPAVVVA